MDIRPKKLLAGLLALIMVLGMLPTSVFAAEADNVVVIENENNTEITNEQSTATVSEATGCDIVILDVNGEECPFISNTSEDESTLVMDNLTWAMQMSALLLDAEGPFTYKITLQQDIDTNAISIPADENVIIDLNGYTLTGTPTEAAAYQVIQNKGNLTIEGPGSIVCDHDLAGSTSYAVNTITNGGTLTINGANIVNKSTASYQIGYCIDNNSTTGDAILVVNSGSLTASGSNYYDGIRQFCNSQTNENSVTVNGGNVSSVWLQNPSDGTTEKNTKDVKGSTTITGGTVGTLYTEPSTGFEAAVTGGNIKTITYNESAEGRDLTGFVTGGTFDSLNADLVATGATVTVAGKEMTKTEEGTLEEVVELPEYVVLPDGVTVADFGSNTVTDGTNFYATLKDALLGIHLTDNRVLYCKPGADVGVMTHGHVCASLTVYGNGAKLTASGEQDFEVDTYKFCHDSAKTCSGVTGELTLTVKYLDGCGAWGQRTTANTVNLVFENCKDMNRVYINGTSGVNNITLKNCSFLGSVDNRCTLYSNANGTITVDTVEFKNIYAPVNLNHKVAGTQTVVIKNSTFTDCGTAEYDYAAPVRVLSSVDGAKTELTVSGTTFTGTKANKQGQTADILLDYGVGETTASVSTTAANVTVEKEDNVGTTTTVTTEETNDFTNVDLPVAQIGETGYATLQAAIDAAQAGNTITLLTDIVVEDTITVPAGTTVTLDLNGKTISQTKAQTGNYQMILNDGNLTIVDSIGGGKISYTDTIGGNFISNTITNRGTLTLKSGRVENMSSAAVANAGFPYAIDTSIWGAATEVNTVIEGGEVYCESYSALRLRADSETEPVNITISGGKVSGRIEVQNPTSSKATVGKLTITGGEVNKNKSSKAIMIFGGGGTAEKMEVAISGGTITGEIGYSNNFPINGFDEKIITGGTFDTDVSGFCAEGYVVEENNGSYGVVVDPAYGKTAKIGNTYYTTIAEAIAAAKDGDTVVIMPGEYGAINISNKNITIQGTVGTNGELLTTIKGGNPAITGHGFNGTIKDLKIVDAWKVMYAEPAGNVTVDNVHVTGATYGLHLVAYSTGLTWTIQNSYMDLAWANSFGVYQDGDAAIIIKGNTFESTAPYYPDYGTLAVNTFLPNVTVEENIFGENAKIMLRSEDTSKVTIGTNYYADGYANAYVEDSVAKVDITTYYAELNTDGTINKDSLVERKLEGEGTAENPYLVNNLEDLKLFRDQVNAGNNFSGKYVKLTADIDLAGEAWTPIGNVTYNSKYVPADTTKVFSGVFDGNDKVISNLTISSTVGGADTQANVGLFGITGEGAVIKNLTITNVNITTDGRNVGALAGFAYKATLDNITVNGNIQIKGGNNVAGVCGMTRYYEMSATNISVKGNAGSAIVGNNIVGGIFAEIAPNGSAQTFRNLSVENVAITGVGGVGGIVGLQTEGVVDTVSVKNVVLTGRTDYQGNAMGRIRLGSVAGLLGSKYATIKNATVENVTAKNLDGNAVVLPIIGANYDASSNATEAKIGDTYYATLAEAIKAAQAGDTVTLLADVAADVVVAADKNIVLDLNGNDIVGTMNAITNNGTLVINDTVGTGNVYTTDVAAQGRATIVNNGTLTINAGWFGDSNNDTTDRNAINRGNALKNYGTATINGGYFTNVSNQYISAEAYAYAINTMTGGTTTINNATVYGDINGLIYSDGETVVEDGSFTLGRPNEENNLWYLAYGNVEIKGGTWNRAYKVPSWNTSDPTFYGEVEISGGTFTNDVSEFAAEGYIVEKNADGTYGVKAWDGVTIANLAQLKMFRDKVNAGDTYAGKTVTLTADIDLAGENWVGIGSINAEHGFMGNFDGNGHKIMNLTITDPALDSDGYAYAGLFSITEGIDKDNQNIIKNLIIENVTISTNGHIVSAAIAYPYYTIVENVKVCGDISITGGDYTSGVLAYTRRCVNASGLYVVGNDGSTITGRNTVGGVISDIQMNGGLTADYSNFHASNVKISGAMHVGGISGIISSQKVTDVSVKNVTLDCTNARVGIVAGTLGGAATITNVTYENVTGANAIVGAEYSTGKAVQAKIGETYYATLTEALTAWTEGTTLTLMADAEISAPIVITESKTLDGNGKKLTYTGTDRAIEIPMEANGADVTIKNLTIDALSANRGINYNTNGKLIVEKVTVSIGADVDGYAINFPSYADNAEVTITNSNLTSRIPVNVWGSGMEIEITDTHITSLDNSPNYSYSGIQLNRDQYGNIADGTVVTVTGGSITALDEEDNPSLAVSNWSSTGKVNISDTTVVTGDVKNVVAWLGGVGYTDLQTAFNDIAKQGYNSPLILVRDITLDESVTVPEDVKITLDLNGHTITGTDNTTNSFGLITNKGDLTIKDSLGTGKITLTATQDTGYNRYSTVISNTVGGKLTVESGTIEHLGGHTMAYAIDNLTNGKGTYAETVINGGTVKSSYVGIRQFLNGIEAQNILTVNGGTVTGNNTSIFFQDPSANCNSGKLVVGENATLGNRIYVSGTAGTPWDVEIAVSAQALGTYGITTDEIPADCVIKETNGVYGIVKAVASVNGIGYVTLTEALAAAQPGDTVTLLADVELDATLTINKAITIDGNGKKITTSAAFVGNASNAMIDIQKNITFNNVVFDGVKNVAVMRAVSANVVMDNCVVQNCEHTVSQGLLRLACGNATITNSKFLNNKCTMVITFGYDAANDTDVMTVDNCVFQGNTCSETAVVYFAAGDYGKVTNTKFIGNTVTSAGNAATLYMGWGEGYEVSGCLFDGNTVTTSHATTKRFASAIFCDGCTVNGNVFTNNTATRNGETISTVVAVAAYYGAADIGENYWNDGSKPAKGDEFTIEYTRNPVAIEDYYTSLDADGTPANLKKMPAGKIAYRGYIEDSASREAVKVDLQNIYAETSVVVKLYDANGNLLTTTTLKAGGFEGDWLTTNIVLSGTASGSWDTVISAEKLTIANVPSKGELWIDGELMDSFDNILGKATDAAAYQLPAYLNLNCVYKAAKIGDTYYATLADALAEWTEDTTLTLMADAEISASIVITESKTLDLNGHTITGTDNSTGNFGLINLNPGAEFILDDTVGTGKITLTATNNRGWGGYSSVISVQRAKLTVNAGTLEHLGGSDMAYAIDILTNTGADNAEAVINGGTIKSTYRAIRQFANSTKAETILTVNGGTIEGANKSIWVQNANALNNPAELSVNASAAIKGDVLVSGSNASEWTLKLSVNEAALQGESTVVGSKLPETMVVENANGVWGIADAVASVNGVGYATLADALAAAQDGDIITILRDVAMTAPVVNTKKVTIELNGKTVSYTTTENKGESMITNRGDLTIQDSVGGGKLSYAYTGAADSSYGYGNQTIENFGTLTLVSGTVENTSAAMSHASYAINNREGATLNIQGGKVLNLNAHAIRQTSFGTAANTVNISGGYVEGTRAIQFQLPGSAGAAAAEMTLNISGGQLKSNEATYNLALYVYSNGQSAEKVKINITGGTFNGNVAINAAATGTMADNAVSVTDGVFNGEYGVFSYADDEVAKPVISLTGGTYKTDYSEIYAQDDGYVFKQNADGTYGLTKAPAAFHDNNGDGVYTEDVDDIYETVAQALAAAKSGDVVVMNADSDETGTTLVIMKGVTLDLNGHDLTADGLVAFKGNYLIDSANSRVSSADTGALIVPKGNLSLPEDNAELPFWTGSEYALLDPNTSTASGYQGVKIPTDNGFRFEFRPGFGYIDGKSVRSNYLLNGGTDNEIQMILRMSWTNSRGQVVVQDFEYTDEMFTEAYQSGNIFYLNVRGTANLGEITITAVVVSDTGVEFIGESCVYNAADYATGE